MDNSVIRTMSIDRHLPLFDDGALRPLGDDADADADATDATDATDADDIIIILPMVVVDG